MTALEQQIGGNHYKGLSYQPIVLATNCNFNFFQGSASKYVSRYKLKNGLEDLGKAVHYAELGRELTPENFADVSKIQEVDTFVDQNGLSPLIKEILVSIFFQNWNDAIEKTKQLMTEEYECTC